MSELKKKGGRPKLKTDEIKKVFINVRLTEEEKKLVFLKADSANLTPSVFLRSAALDLKIKPAVPQINMTAYRELQRLSGVLNRLTKSIQFSEKVPEIALVRIAEDLAKIRLSLIGG